MTTKYLLISIGLLLVSLSAMGQPPPPPATPIDGGLSLLLAGGAVYGIRQISKKRTKS